MSGPTIVGGGDSDVTTPFNSSVVYGTGLTLANVTLAASCDNGQTWTSNPISNVGTAEDRQWIDSYEDSAKPLGAPDFVLVFGRIVAGRMAFFQVASPPPACSPPAAEAPLDTSHPNCVAAQTDCYQWPGNVVIDEKTGDAYVTHNTRGNPNNDDVVVSRVDGGGGRPATQADVRNVVAANDRPNTFDSFTVVDVDKAGNVYVVWSERHQDVNETWTMIARSTDRGQTWSAPIKVNSTPKTTTFPWIVAGAAGKVDIVYYGTEAKGQSPETVPADSQWKVYMAQSLNMLDPNPAFEEVAATGVMHQGRICTSGTGCAAGTRDLLDFFQIDVDEQGLANIAYTDTLNPPGVEDYVVFVQQNGGPGLLTPTAATVTSFDARARGRGVELRWRTASEAGVAGFDVFRVHVRRTTRVNARLIEATGSAGGGRYRLVDRTARRGATYKYRLQLVRLDGSRGVVRSIRVRAR